jgi:transmembrane sensor
MQRDEFLHLFEKQLQGTITSEEERRLSAWFEQQQSTGLSQWDQEQLGNQKELEDHIYYNITKKGRQPLGIRLQRHWLAIAASIILVSICALLWHKTSLEGKTENTAARYTRTTARYGEVLKVMLADSSMVWLNAGSSLRYPEKFEGKTRELYLEGEAFFEVTPNREKPFIVHSGELNTRVLGTSFNIKAYKNSDQLKVSVATGKVAISVGKIPPVLLIPNQTGTYSKDLGQISTEQGQVTDLTAWREGKLIYRNELLSLALDDIENKYGVHISSSPAMKNCRIYGTFNHDHLETLLKMIAYSVKAKVIKKGADFYISGEGCN